MSNNTPLFNHVAVSIDAEQMELIEEKISLELLSEKSAQLELTSQASIVCIKDDEGVSLAFVQQLAHAFAKRNSQEYENFILDYASEWHDIVTAMLDSEIDLVRQLQRRRFHYERKVGALRRRTNTIESRGKDVPAALGEKLLRNEQKLSHAWENHEQRATRLCALLEEVTENGWKDLYPLIQNTMKFEWNRVSRDMTSFGRLKILLNELNNHFAQPQPLGT